MINFYLAAKYDKRTQLLPIAATLMLAGHGVTSQWLNGTHDGNDEESEKMYSKLDLEHVDACTHFAVFNLPIGDAEGSSGRNVEFGYALARRKNLIVIGNSSCIFYSLAGEFYSTVEEFLAHYALGSKL